MDQVRGGSTVVAPSLRSGNDIEPVDREHAAILEVIKKGVQLSR
jgi:1-deoxy-D-xylulose 5-phosphate reductoisomerase